MTTSDEFDLGFDFNITKITRRHSAAGIWVSGTLHDHRFQALVFPEHAEYSEYEINDSRISKLWIQRIADKVVTYNWDRGADIPAADRLTQAIVDFLSAGLADHVFRD